MLLEREGRKAVWCMSKLLGVDKNGVPGQACELLERYLSIYMRETTLNDGKFMLLVYRHDDEGLGMSRGLPRHFRIA